MGGGCGDVSAVVIEEFREDYDDDPFLERPMRMNRRWGVRRVGRGGREGREGRGLVQGPVAAGALGVNGTPTENNKDAGRGTRASGAPTAREVEELANVLQGRMGIAEEEGNALAGSPTHTHTPGPPTAPLSYHASVLASRASRGSGVLGAGSVAGASARSGVSSAATVLEAERNGTAPASIAPSARSSRPQATLPPGVMWENGWSFANLPPGS